MKKTYIVDKLGLIYIENGKVLMAKSLGKNKWYMPGGKREEGESDKETLTREVKEELAIDLKPETMTYFGAFEAQAHGKPPGVLVKVTCYITSFEGNPRASGEIEKIDFFSFSQKHLTSAVDWLIFDALKAKGLIN